MVTWNDNSEHGDICLSNWYRYLSACGLFSLEHPLSFKDNVMLHFDPHNFVDTPVFSPGSKGLALEQLNLYPMRDEHCAPSVSWAPLAREWYYDYQMALQRKKVPQP